MKFPFCKSYCYYWSFSWARISLGIVTMGWQYRACQWSIPRDNEGAKWSSGWENHTMEAEFTPDWFVNFLSTWWLRSLKLGKLSLAHFRELFVSLQAIIAFSIPPTYLFLFTAFWIEKVLFVFRFGCSAHRQNAAILCEPAEYVKAMGYSSCLLLVGSWHWLLPRWTLLSSRILVSNGLYLNKQYEPLFISETSMNRV